MLESESIDLINDMLIKANNLCDPVNRPIQGSIETYRANKNLPPNCMVINFDNLEKFVVSSFRQTDSKKPRIEIAHIYRREEIYKAEINQIVFYQNNIFRLGIPCRGKTYEEVQTLVGMLEKIIDMATSEKKNE